MNNRVVKACLAAGCTVAGPVLAFSAAGFGVKALDSEGVSSATPRPTKSTPWMGQSFNAQAVSSMTRLQYPSSEAWMAAIASFTKGGQKEGVLLNTAAAPSRGGGGGDGMERGNNSGNQVTSTSLKSPLVHKAQVVRHPALAVPHLSLAHIGHLDFEGLKAMGCKGVIFDKDNTLTAPYEDSAHPLVEEGLKRCMEVFEGRVCIMSNSAGTRDDPGYADAIRIETALGIPVLRHDEKKPGGIAEVLAFFEGRDPDGGSVQLDELCFVGDRLLTDVVFGNLHGMLTVHTQPLTLKGDNRPAAIFRFLERKVFMSFFHETCSVEPRPHRLCPDGAGVLDQSEEVVARREAMPVSNGS